MASVLKNITLLLGAVLLTAATVVADSAPARFATSLPTPEPSYALAGHQPVTTLITDDSGETIMLFFPVPHCGSLQLGDFNAQFRLALWKGPSGTTSNSGNVPCGPVLNHIGTNGGTPSNDVQDTIPVPEPGTMFLLTAGMAGVWFRRRFSPMTPA